MSRTLAQCGVWGRVPGGGLGMESAIDRSLRGAVLRLELGVLGTSRKYHGHLGKDGWGLCYILHSTYGFLQGASEWDRKPNLLLLFNQITMPGP